MSALSLAPSRPNRAARFATSRTARKEVRRAVALAKELGLHAVDVRGVKWVIRHEPRPSTRGSNSGPVAGAAAAAPAGDTEVPEREARPPNRKQRRSQARMRTFNLGKRMQAERAVEPAASSMQHDEEGLRAAASISAAGAAPLVACESALDRGASANPMDDKRASKRTAGSSPAQGVSSLEHQPNATGLGSSHLVKRHAAHKNHSPRPKLVPRQILLPGAPSHDMTR